MTHNDALLRLAKIVESIASGDGPHWPTEDVRQLIRDLEAAPTVQAPRTITQEEFRNIEDRCLRLRNRNTTVSAAVDHILRTLRLTVEG